MAGRAAGRFIAGIDRYHRSAFSRRVEGCCRFNPGCSGYAAEAFATKRLPVALLMTAWRLLRCNPLARRGTLDPVVRSRRTRPNALRTVFSSMMLAGLVTLLIGSATAYGQSITGGCTATINGRAPTTLTRSNPLVVGKGEAVTVSGKVPPALADKETKSFTSISVNLFDPLYKYSSSSQHPGTGSNWGGSQNVDDYLKLGSGLYQASGTATIASPKGSGSCTADGYIKFDGARTVQAIAGAVAVGGAVGTALSPGTAKKDIAPDDIGSAAVNFIEGQAGPAEPPVDPVTEMADEFLEPLPDDMRYEIEYAAAVLGCCMVAAFASVAMLVGTVAPPSGGSTPRQPLRSAYFRKKGHTILGFIFGLLFGIGLTVVIQQQGLWVLNVLTAIVLPLAFAVLSAIRARMGKRYRITLYQRA